MPFIPFDGARVLARLCVCERLGPGSIDLRPPAPTPAVVHQRLLLVRRRLCGEWFVDSLA